VWYSNDHLGMSQHPAVVEAAIGAAKYPAFGSADFAAAIDRPRGAASRVAQGQRSGRFRITLGTAGTWSGSPTSMRSSTIVDVARVSDRRSDGYGRASAQTSQLHHGLYDAIADHGNGRGTRRWHPSITTGICAT
jgi:hypothetical protein